MPAKQIIRIGSKSEDMGRLLNFYLSMAQDMRKTKAWKRQCLQMETIQKGFGDACTDQSKERVYNNR